MELNWIKSHPVGVVGLGLMGRSIVVALLAAGHRVIAVAPIAGERASASKDIGKLLEHASEAGLLTGDLASYIRNLKIVETYADLSACGVVMECVIEDKQIKKKVYQRITDVVSADTVIASNTSAIPISELQELVSIPARFLGIHWAEPAYMTRFLEITCGKLTDPALGPLMVSMGETWGKEPTLLTKDIRGFITNRLMYAVYREAFALVEEGHTTMSDADKVFRYDAGAWVTFMGVFERMSLEHPDIAIHCLNTLFPKLSNRGDVPRLMQQLVVRSAKGIHDLQGLYPYTEETARRWEEAFSRFNKDIFQLAARYNEYKKRKSLSRVKPAVRTG